MKHTTFLSMLVMLTAGLLFFSTSSFGQGCHGSSNSSGHSHSVNNSNNPRNYALNGGTVKSAGKYKIEMVFQPVMKQDPLVFYLMKKNGKPKNNSGITGKTEITYADGSTETVILVPRDENGFAGQIGTKTTSFICLVTLKINDENVTVRFDGGLDKKENSNANYTCSMHPEVKSDKPDNCPKCGMTLEKVNK